MIKEDVGRENDFARIKIKDWLIDYVYIVGAVSCLLAIIATIIIFVNPGDNFYRYFPGMDNYIKHWFMYGWMTTILMILLIQIRRNLNIISSALKAILILLLNLTKLNARLGTSEVNLFKKLNNKLKLGKGEKAIIELTSDVSDSKVKYALRAPIDVLPVNKTKKKERSFSNDKYEAMVKTAFTRVGAMNEEQLLDVRVYDVKEGPRAIQINISLPNGTTVSSLKNKTEDLRHAFDAPSFQIEAGRAGRANLTIFLKENTRIVLLRDILERDDIQSFIQKAKLPIIVGVDPVGEPILFDLVKAPHLLVAGATLSGKTWWIMQVLYLLFMKLSPEELEVWIVDPKFVDFAEFKGVPHVKRLETEVEEAVTLLDQAVRLMDDRYRTMQKYGCRNIEHYNSKFPSKKMPYIVISIDEIADLIMQAKESVSTAIARLAQKGRAAGIHMINATQRPSVQIIDGNIKANLPSRITFKLKTNTDYTTILGYGINTELQGFGDGVADLEGFFGYQRFQSPGVGSDDTEIDFAINRLIEFWNTGISQVQGENKGLKTKNALAKLDKNCTETIESNINKGNHTDEIMFYHGIKEENKDVVPFSNSKDGTTIVNLKKEENLTFFNSENKVEDEDEYDDYDSDNSIDGEGDIDSYHRLMILQKIKKELQDSDSSGGIIYAPSSNKLCSEIGIRKSTILEHLGDLLKEDILEQHPTNKRYIIKTDMEELDQMIDDIDRALKFINSK